MFYAYPQDMMRLVASRGASAAGELLVSKGQCPSPQAYDYAVSPTSDGKLGITTADCPGASQKQEAWFVALKSTAGTDAQGLSQSSVAQIETLERQGSRQLAQDLGTSEWKGQCDDLPALDASGCNALLTSGQTHYFSLADVPSEQLLKVEACAIDQATGGCDAADTGWLALLLSPGEECVDSGSTAYAADPLTGAWPSEGSYRLSECTMESTQSWSLAVSARFTPELGYKAYRLVVHLLGNGWASDAALLATDIINTTDAPIQRGFAGQLPHLAYANDWNFYFVRVGIESEMTVTVSSAPADFGAAHGLQLVIGDASSCLAMRAGGAGAGSFAMVDSAVDDNPRHTYKATSAPRPESPAAGGGYTSDCADTAGAVRNLIIGVHGVKPLGIGPDGQPYTLTVDIRQRELQVGVSREVAVTSSDAVGQVFLLPVGPGKAFTVTAHVTRRTGATIRGDASAAVPVDALRLHLATKVTAFAIDATETSAAVPVVCGWPSLISALAGVAKTEDQVAADLAASENGRSAMPLSVFQGQPDGAGGMRIEISVSECAEETTEAAGTASDELWYVVLQSIGLSDGAYLQVDLVSSYAEKQFKATDTTAGLVLSQQWNHYFLQSAVEGALTLIVTTTCWQSTDNCLAGGDQRLFLYAEPASAAGGQTCPSTQAADNGGQDGGAGTTVPGVGLSLEVTICTSADTVYSVAIRGGDFPALYNGAGIDYQIAAFSRNQSNLASMRRTDVLVLEGMQRNAWEYHYFEMPDPTRGASTYPFDLKLIVKPDDSSPTATMGDVEVQVRLAGCGEAAPPEDDGEGITREETPFQLDISMTAPKLFTVYKAVEAAAIANRPATCEAADVVSCIGARNGLGPIACCFSPRIFVAIQGRMQPGQISSFTLQPELRCEAGYRAAGGEDGTYADACIACEAGKYQDQRGAAVCLSCVQGKFQNETGANRCEDCPLGHQCPAKDLVSPEECIEGRFSANEGRETCAQCAIGKYAEERMTIQCDDCPDFTTTASQGTTSRLSCFCQPDHYEPLLRNGQACENCNELQQGECLGGQAQCTPGAVGCGFSVPVAGTTIEYVPKMMPVMLPHLEPGAMTS